MPTLANGVRRPLSLCLKGSGPILAPSAGAKSILRAMKIQSYELVEKFAGRL